MISARRLKIAGFALVALAGTGFLTVADEFRHIGELFGVVGILMAGIACLVAGLFPKVSTAFVLQWVPVGIAVGMIVGAASDRMVAGVCAGTVFGMVLAFFLRIKPSSR